MIIGYLDPWGNVSPMQVYYELAQDPIDVLKTSRL